ncbi:MAG: HAD-IA family hydrolase [Sphingomonadales bacterium]|jgi:phosphoglycolate phosphatase
MSTLKLVVFDCDGTLVDSQHMIMKAMDMAFSEKSMVSPSLEEVRRIVGLSLFHAVGKLYPDGSDKEVEVLVDGYRRAFHQLRKTENHEPLYDGTVEALDALANAGYIMGVATGKSKRGLVNTLAQHEISHHFVTLQTADDHPSKPHPQMLETAIREAGVLPEHTILIGDTSYDMGMAKNAGVIGLGVSWGYHPSCELTEHGAKAIANTYEDVPGLISQLFEKRG